MSTSIVIIGAGVAGLSAGCYAQMNGYRSQIFEMHNRAGGLCTSWKRGDYRFEAGVRSLTGTGPQCKAHQLWEELGVAEGWQIHYYDMLLRFEGADGRALCVYTDIDRLERHLLDLAPQDQDAIEDFVHGVRQFTHMELPVDLTPSSLLELVQLGQDMLPSFLPILRWHNVTVREFAARFQDPLLREALPRFFEFSPSDFPMVVLLSTLAKMNDREAGFPVGGSSQLAQDLARNYLALGGQIHTKARVEKVLVEASSKRWGDTDHAMGVRLQDSSEHRGDIVISAADGRGTIFGLLEGRYLDDRLRSYYRELPLAKSLLQVSLGVARDFVDEPATIDFPLGQPITLGNVPHDRLVLKHYCFDPTMAPAGKSILGIWCDADYDYWNGLHEDRQQYRAAKEQAAEQVISALEERYPGLRDAIEVVDVATPLTYERFTANWRGAFAGWALSTRKMDMMMQLGMSKTLPGLGGFYMIGQWVEPGGSVDLSAASGRDVIKEICRLGDRPFSTDRLRRRAALADSAAGLALELPKIPSS